MYNSDSSATLTNVTFSGNSAYGGWGGYGGGMYNSYGSATLTNSILWGNTAATGAEIYSEYDSASNVTYSIVRGGWTGTGNLNVDPLFVRPPSAGLDGTWGTADDDYGDLRLQSTSRAIDAGSNRAVLSDAADLDGDGDTLEPTPLDLDMLPRFFDVASVPDTGVGPAPIVDMGAYEHQNSPPVASDQDVTANKDTAKPITLTATDPDNDELTFSIVSFPSHGTLTDFDAGAGTVVYAPDPDYHGGDSFTFRAYDGIAYSNVATVSITVLSAQEQIEVIKNEVFQWLDEGFINHGQCNALQSKLDDAIANLDDGKTTLAVHKLEAFENQVRALIQRGLVPAERGNAVIALTEAAIDSALARATEATDAVFAELDAGDATDGPLDRSLLDDLVSVASSKSEKGRK